MVDYENGTPSNVEHIFHVQSTCRSSSRTKPFPKMPPTIPVKSLLQVLKVSSSIASFSKTPVAHYDIAMQNAR